MGKWIMNIGNNNRDYINFLNKVRGLGLIDNTDKEYWGYITAHHNQLHCLYGIFKEGMSFVDLGCGAGNVLKYANNIGYEVTGVEFNETLIKYLEDYNYYTNDIKNLDKEFYKNYDVIYCYRPLKDEELIIYINKVIEYMGVGNYLVIPNHKVKDNRLIKIDNDCYQKIK